MSKTILAEVDGFTPIIDCIVNELGLMSAAVFGRIWRYCQMSDGVCKASLETISEGLGIDKATVMRHADKLCQAGYLKDLTPNFRNKPHSYADTGKANGIVEISFHNDDKKLRGHWTLEAVERTKSMGVSASNCVYCGQPMEVFDHWIPTSRGGSDDATNKVASCYICNQAKRDRTGEEFLEELITRGWITVADEVAESNVTLQTNEKTVAESHLKRVFKKDSKKEKEVATPKANQIPELVLFRSVTFRYPPRPNFDDVIESVHKIEARLGHKATKDDLLFFFKQWTGKGYKETNLAWLEWAEAGRVPQNGMWKSNKDILEKFVQGKT